MEPVGSDGAKGKEQQPEEKEKISLSSNAMEVIDELVGDNKPPVDVKP